MSGKNGDLAELLNAAEAGGVRNVEELLKDDELVAANTEKCIKASKELFSVLARYTNSEASTIVRIWMEQKVGKTPRKKKKNRRTWGIIFRVRRECMYPKPAEYVRCSRLVEDVALLEICPMDVREQMNR